MSGRSNMRDLLARAQATREQVAPALPADSTGQAFEVPRCTHCGAPREAAEGRQHGALSAACRFCKTPYGG